MIHTLVDGIRLVTVGDDGFIAKNTYRSVDDKARVSELGRIKCLGADAFSVLYKDVFDRTKLLRYDGVEIARTLYWRCFP